MWVVLETVHKDKRSPPVFQNSSLLQEYDLLRNSSGARLTNAGRIIFWLLQVLAAHNAFTANSRLFVTPRNPKKKTDLLDLKTLPNPFAPIVEVFRLGVVYLGTDERFDNAARLALPNL